LESRARILDRIMITDLLNRMVGYRGLWVLIQETATSIRSRQRQRSWHRKRCLQGAGMDGCLLDSDGDTMGYRAGAEIVSKEFGGKDGGTLKDFSRKIGVIVVTTAM